MSSAKLLRKVAGHLRRLCWNMRSVRSHTGVHSSPGVVAASFALVSAALTRDARLATWFRRLLKSAIDRVWRALCATAPGRRRTLGCLPTTYWP